MFDVIRFLKDYGIHFDTEGKNTQEDWVQIQCPMCDDHENHGGFNYVKGYFTCWKCKWHPLDKVIKALTNESPYSIIAKYDRAESIRDKLKKKKNIEKVNFILPGEKMRKCHKKYLLERNFDPDYLEAKYGLLGVGHLGNYAFRIVIPIYFEGQIVSYQTRTILDNESVKYITCSKEMEIIHHKHILYNLDHCREDFIVVCEGVTDVWRLGDNAACTFGIEWLTEQAKLLLEYERVFILFDPEDLAQEQADKLAMLVNTLKDNTCEMILIPADCDPGKLSDTDARDLMTDLRNRYF